MRVTVLALIGIAVLVPCDSVAQVINGCVGPSGALRVVADPTACRNNETRISWNQQGPPGEPGQPGEPGPPGPAALSLSVFDATGREIGPVVEGPLSRAPWLFQRATGVVFAVDLFSGALVTRHAPVFFENDDCTGAAYFTLGLTSPDNPPPYLALVQSGSEFFVMEPGTGAPVVTLSRLEGSCSELLRGDRALPARRFSLGELGLTFPLPAPLYVAPSPTD